MLNGIFVFLVLGSLLLAAWSGQMAALNQALLDSAQRAVFDVALKLIGVMALFLGLMRIVQEAGLLEVVARRVAPLTRRLFPGVPVGHPAMSAMILNISCNVLGLGNAATPFGIKAMEELDRLNGEKGTATNAMVVFLAVNTAGFAILPTSTIALRAAQGSTDPTGILFPTWVASGCATLVAVAAAMLFGRLPRFRQSEPAAVLVEDARSTPVSDGGGRARVAGWIPVVAGLAGLAYLALAVRYVWLNPESRSPFDLFRDVMSSWMLPPLVGACVAYGWARGVRVYDALIDGAKEGFQVAVRIIPYLVAILVAVGMFRASGGVAILVRALDPLTSLIGMPAEVLPLALLRPLSGSGSQAFMVDLMSAHGPDSLVGYMAGTVQGSTETTFYIMAVYFGAVGVKRTRHTVPACLVADVAGITTAVIMARLLFG